VARENKSNGDLDLRTSPVQHQADATSVRHRPSHEEIERRAYEIYLERGGLPGNELGDWLRAERELQKVALFKRDWNRLRQWRCPRSEGGKDTRRMKTTERENQ